MAQSFSLLILTLFFAHQYVCILIHFSSDFTEGYFTNFRYSPKIFHHTHHHEIKKPYISVHALAKDLIRLNFEVSAYVRIRCIYRLVNKQTASIETNMTAILNTRFLNNSYENPFMNASGVHCMTTEELDELANSKAGAFITKSSTTLERAGNPEPRYISVPLGSINSMGLPNEGIDYYLSYVLDRQEKYPNAPAIFFSVAGMSIDENLSMLRKIQDSEFNGVTELNLSCPNVPGKPQVAYDFDLTRETLERVFAFFKKPLGIKLPPYFDFAHFDIMAKILNEFPLAYVNSINSVGNGLYIDVDKESVVVKPKNGFGGIGGEYVKPTALANVRAFYTRLRPEIKVIGTGGIKSGKDAFEHLLCGASMLQIGTELQKEGVEIFGRIEKELKDIMEAKGYTSIDQFRGKLNSL